ncbi:hypothetical protein B0O99DRAFT_716581 [Bisporella sp. PMI_857]|nr:hypothetical protein B0O99DRAFT_716581 [Bisporella sp. PMI_857]
MPDASLGRPEQARSLGLSNSHEIEHLSKANFVSDSTHDTATGKIDSNDPILQEAPNGTIAVNQPSLEHLNSLSDFIKKLKRPTDQIISTREKYTRVVTLITYWAKPEDENPDLDHLRKSAEKLRVLFRDTYRFEVEEEPFAIPLGDSLWLFEEKLRQRLGPIRSFGDSLFILYYGGQAEATNSDLMWKADKTESARTDSSRSISWSAAQRSLEGAKCDKLFLFDCCFAGSMINPKLDWSGRTECLGSSQKRQLTNSEANSSFTSALLAELQNPGVSIVAVWEELNDGDKLSTYGLQKGDPFYQAYVGRRGSIILNSLTKYISKDISNSVEEFKPHRKTQARILIKIAFKGTEKQLLKEWQNFVSHAPFNVLKITFGVGLEFDIKLQAFFPSNSCTVLFDIPLRLYGSLLPDVAENFFRVIRGDMYSGSQIGPSGLVALPIVIPQSSLPVASEMQMITGPAPTSSRPTSPQEKSSWNPKPLKNIGKIKTFGSRKSPRKGDTKPNSTGPTELNITERPILDKPWRFPHGDSDSNRKLMRLVESTTTRDEVIYCLLPAEQRAVVRPLHNRQARALIPVR